MIRHIWSVLCRSSAIDRDANALSLFETFEEITLLEPIEEPGGVVPFSFQLVTLWSRRDVTQPARANIRVSAVNPGEAEARQPPTVTQVDLTQHVRLRQRISFAGLQVARAGVKEFVIDVEVETDRWENVARVPLEIKVQEPPAQAH